MSSSGAPAVRSSPVQGRLRGRAEVREVALGFRILVFTWGRHCKQASGLAHGGWDGVGPSSGTSGSDTPTCGLGGE